MKNYGEATISSDYIVEDWLYTKGGVSPYNFRMYDDDDADDGFNDFMNSEEIYTNYYGLSDFVVFDGDDGDIYTNFLADVSCSYLDDV